MIRTASPEDRHAVEPLWAECLGLHGYPFDPDAFGRTWSRALSGDGFGLRVADQGDTLLGFALHGWQLNSWTGADEGILDTLFVAGAARGRGLARALVEDLLHIARARSWRTVFWHVEHDNAPARALYDRFALSDGYLRYRVTP